MVIEKRYYWKRLLAGGVLADPPPRGPRYDEDVLNVEGFLSGYLSEDAALAALEAFVRKHGVQDELFLIAGYHPE